MAQKRLNQIQNNIFGQPLQTFNKGKLPGKYERQQEPRAGASTNAKQGKPKLEEYENEAIGTLQRKNERHQEPRGSKSSNEEKTEAQLTEYEDVEVSDKTDISKQNIEFNEQRKLLRLYFDPAFRWRDNVCSFHLIYFLVFLVQVVKVALVTGQMVYFGHDRANFSELVNRGHLTLRHMLLENWSAFRETPPYPPTAGEFAVYRLVDAESRINYAVTNYFNIQHDTMGYYTRIETDNISMTIKYFQFPDNNANESQHQLEIQEHEISLNAGLSTKQINGRNVYAFDIMKNFRMNNLNDLMQRMLSATLYFTLHSVRVFEQFGHGKCLHIQGWVTFSDVDNNGQVIINLETLTSRIQCKDINLNISDWSLPNTSQALGMAVVVFSSMSIIYTMIAIAFMCYVWWKTKQFMRKYYQIYYKPMDREEKDLPMSEYLKFLKFWDVIVIISDILTLYGTSFIVNHTERDRWIVETLDYYTVWLSVGGILGWLSLFRFFKFHNKFNLLFSTLYRAFGDVLAYLLCVMVLYASFWISGYVVLSPYHVKFSTPTLAAETLTSIVNGDEIFATLAMLENAKTGGVWEFYKTRPEERTLGPLERALRRYLSEKDSQHGVKESIYGLLSGPQSSHSAAAKILIKEFGKLVRLDNDKKDIVLLKTKTLKSFINDEDADVTGPTFEIGFLKFSFLSFPKRG